MQIYWNKYGGYILAQTKNSSHYDLAPLASQMAAYIMVPQLQISLSM